MKKINFRNIHRDLGYFYIGLIESFAFSGLMMNHRESWHPDKYTTQTKANNAQLPTKNEINDDFAKDLGKKLGIDDKMRRQMVKQGTFKISFENNDVDIDMKTGKGEITTFVKTLIIRQMMGLHKNN